MYADDANLVVKDKYLNKYSYTVVGYSTDRFMYMVVGLSRFTHVTIRFDSVRSRSDRFDPIHYPLVQTNTTKMCNLECHLNDLLNKITMNKKR